jgi:hypothetical protein
LERSAAFAVLNRLAATSAYTSGLLILILQPTNDEGKVNPCRSSLYGGENNAIGTGEDKCILATLGNKVAKTGNKIGEAGKNYDSPVRALCAGIVRVSPEKHVWNWHAAKKFFAPSTSSPTDRRHNNFMVSSSLDSEQILGRSASQSGSRVPAHRGLARPIAVRRLSAACAWTRPPPSKFFNIPIGVSGRPTRRRDLFCSPQFAMDKLICRHLTRLPNRQSRHVEPRGARP